MPVLDYSKINTWTDVNIIKPFYEKRIEKIQELNLKKVLKRKNPYLFRAKNIDNSGDFVSYVLGAFLSSQEETLFGNSMEKLAIYINSLIFDGSKAEEKKFGSVDLIFSKDNKVYIVGIKSGIHWGNSDQINRMKNNFKKAKEILKSEGEKKEIIAINGCVYGQDTKPFKLDTKDSSKNYYKLAGQAFWELISGDTELYKKIILPLDEETKRQDIHFKKMYAQKQNEMIKEFSDEFLTKSNSIDWNKIIEFVSKSQSRKT